MTQTITLFDQVPIVDSSTFVTFSVTSWLDSFVNIWQYRYNNEKFPKWAQILPISKNVSKNGQTLLNYFCQSGKISVNPVTLIPTCSPWFEFRAQQLLLLFT